MHIVTNSKKTKEGYVLINLMFILMIVSILSLFSYSIIHNNLLRTSIKYSYVDLYNKGYIEDSISKVNYYLKNNNINLDEVKENKQTLNINSNIYFKYDYSKSNFIMIDVSNRRVEIKLREKLVDNNWYVVPYEQKYML